MYRVDDGRRWRGAMSWTEPDGTRRRRIVSGRTSEEARANLDALRRDLHLGTVAPKGRAITVAEFLSEWLERDAARVRPSTHAVREQHVRCWITPAIGKLTLARLTPADVERMLAEFSKNGRPVTPAESTKAPSRQRRTAAPRTVAHVRASLRVALGDARRDGLVGRNAAGDARPPRVPYQAIVYLSARQVRRLLLVTSDHEYGPLFAVAVSTGLRQGEILALRWEDVNLEAGRLSVRHALARTAAGDYAVGETKTSKSRRTLPLSQTARDALRRQRTRQDTAWFAAGPAWQDPRGREGTVFTDSVGRPLDPPHVTYAFQKALAAAGLPRVRFHDLRHSAATIMLSEGVPLAVVSEVLGHSSIAITSAHYAAIVPELLGGAAEAVDRALRGTA